MEEKLLTVGEAAAKLNVSLRTVQRYCKQGLLAHQWIIGKRHKELRIVAPLPLSRQQGNGKKTAPGTSGFVTRDAYLREIGEIRAELAEKDGRIGLLEQEIQILKLSLGEPGAGGVPDPSLFSDILNRIRELIDDYEKVRAAEKKLVLKLAREVQEHDRFLVTLGKDGNPQTTETHQ